MFSLVRRRAEAFGIASLLRLTASSLSLSETRRNGLHRPEIKRRCDKEYCLLCTALSKSPHSTKADSKTFIKLFNIKRKKKRISEIFLLVKQFIGLLYVDEYYNFKFHREIPAVLEKFILYTSIRYNYFSFAK